MYKMFGDWDLVLASYSGPGNVKPSDVRVGSKIIGTSEKSSERNARICPRFLATMYIYEYHKEHGIVPNRAVVKHFGYNCNQTTNDLQANI
jgi:membrane-bound lytic murein transglycosylase D